jgi:hypothetical protein
MLPVTREIMLFLIVALTVVLAIIIVLILRSHFALRRIKTELAVKPKRFASRAKPEKEKPGKEKKMPGEKPEEKPEPKTEAKPDARKEDRIVPDSKKAAIHAPHEADEERGKEGPAPEPPIKMPKTREKELLEIKEEGAEEGEDEAGKVLKKKVEEEPESEMPEEEKPESARKPGVTSAWEIVDKPKDFYGKTVVLEGHMRLSSRGKEEFWYVLSDDSGTVVVRSTEDIPLKDCRVTATVEETSELGQTYLELKKCEPV